MLEQKYSESWERKANREFSVDLKIYNKHLYWTAGIIKEQTPEQTKQNSFLIIIQNITLFFT